ncbi:energy transducer TonB [Thiomicrorhabdus sp.]|uniref:energy transducer TonB n=1 Tax=Thiomicrorhabdus sp. TaxID=2039724 RepID=UPI0029C72737|nr:energy transducer TonB [Thiomicrorhabdus sp.]
MKLLLPIAVALVINAILFGLMQQMTVGRKIDLDQKMHAEIIDFIRSPDALEQPVETRRRLPPEPPKENLQPMQTVTRMKQAAKSNPQPLPLPVSALKLSEISTNLQVDGPYLGPVLTEYASEGLEYSGGLELVMGQDMMAINRSFPRYPRKLKRRRIEGEVVVEFTVTALGLVEDPKIVESHPQGAFDNSVLRAVQKWKFQPRKRNGRAVPVRVRQKVVFSLKK